MMRHSVTYMLAGNRGGATSKEAFERHRVGPRSSLALVGEILPGLNIRQSRQYRRKNVSKDTLTELITRRD